MSGLYLACAAIALGLFAYLVVALFHALSPTGRFGATPRPRLSVIHLRGRRCSYRFGPQLGVTQFPLGQPPMVIPETIRRRPVPSEFMV